MKKHAWSLLPVTVGILAGYLLFPWLFNKPIHWVGMWTFFIAYYAGYFVGYRSYEMHNGSVKHYKSLAETYMRMSHSQQDVVDDLMNKNADLSQELFIAKNARTP